MAKPTIRFRGFDDEWEQRKLGDVLDDMYNGQTPSRNKSEYWNGNIKWLSSGELNRGTVYDSIEMITEDGQKSANLRIVPKGTFIMAITGLEAAGTRGNCALLGFDTTLNQSCMALFPKKDLLTSDFLFQWYRKVGEEYGLNYTQGTKQQSYNAELIKILPISLPSVAEQKKIASYLSHIDHLITLHQRKCDETKKLKKYMLQKMFPQNGSKVPEIRFKGFTDEWEQRKLGEVLKERSERANGSEELLSVTIGNGVIKQADSDKRNTASDDKSNYKIVRKGDLPYNSMRMWQGAVGNSEYDGIVSPAYTVLVPTEEANSKFFMELFKKESTLQIFQRWSQGLTSDTWNLKYPALSTIQFYIPSVFEQTKIADYFIQLDHLITLHQHKCEEIKKLKKFMLQNMFI
ncbi:restriction endonuclease subunit S [Blautia massiliensis (ex Durand et al. 2017)]|uniref:restriction endonuclease subunit S n=1 Tax=Blautia massiliensis (ex Durand et al. 2017) TaxID=1737424 RepID=UPI0022E1797F|nr:restriction endonuclease subunit S [Blautia massiliensis (ex Durand et al. 2017)]